MITAAFETEGHDCLKVERDVRKLTQISMTNIGLSFEFDPSINSWPTRKMDFKDYFKNHESKHVKTVFSWFEVQFLCVNQLGDEI